MMKIIALAAFAASVALAFPVGTANADTLCGQRHHMGPNGACVPNRAGGKCAQAGAKMINPRTGKPYGMAAANAYCVPG
jgi:hypothetical protein